MTHQSGGVEYQVPTQMPDGGRPNTESSPSVLIADDDTDLRETFTLWLDEKANVREAEDGMEALAKLDSEIDVVVLDRRMPELSGPEVVDRLDETDFDGPVIVLSAYGPDEHLPEDAVTQYLTKPIDRETFLAELEHALR